MIELERENADFEPIACGFRCIAGTSRTRPMGWEQRNRKHLPQGTICYLCAEPIIEGQPCNRDHVPRQRFYGKSLREQFNPNLGWLYSHTTCNTTYKKDEE